MAQHLKALAAKPDDRSLIPRTNMVEAENPLLRVVLWPPQAYCGTHSLFPQVNKCAFKMRKSWWKSSLSKERWVLSFGAFSCSCALPVGEFILHGRRVGWHWQLWSLHLSLGLACQHSENSFIGLAGVTCTFGSGEERSLGMETIKMRQSQMSKTSKT